jgi:hypothetical protein
MNEYKYICIPCNFKTKSIALWEVHEKTKKHQLDGKYPKGYENRKIRRDKKMGTEIKCKYCDYENQNIGNLKKHILNNHSTVEEREKEFKYYCKECNYGSFGKLEYDNHIKSKKHLENIENT